jgi:hypothetical protein
MTIKDILWQVLLYIKLPNCLPSKNDLQYINQPLALYSSCLLPKKDLQFHFYLVLCVLCYLGILAAT